jgi:hypothetical protein
MVSIYIARKTAHAPERDPWQITNERSVLIAIPVIVAWVPLSREPSRDDHG